VVGSLIPSSPHPSVSHLRSEGVRSISITRIRLDGLYSTTFTMRMSRLLFQLLIVMTTLTTMTMTTVLAINQVGVGLYVL